MQNISNNIARNVVLVFLWCLSKLIRKMGNMRRTRGNKMQFSHKGRLGLHKSLLWCQNGRGGVSNHQPHDFLLNIKLCVTGLCAGDWPVNYPHKWPVARKMFPFDDVIMFTHIHQKMYSYMICTIHPSTRPGLVIANDMSLKHLISISHFTLRLAVSLGKLWGNE